MFCFISDVDGGYELFIKAMPQGSTSFSGKWNMEAMFTCCTKVECDDLNTTYNQYKYWQISSN